MCRRSYSLAVSQSAVRGEINYKEISKQLSRLCELVQQNAEVTHRISLQQQNISIISEVIDRIDSQMIELRREVSASKISSFGTQIIALKNHMSSLVDIAKSTTKENVCMAIKTITADLSRELKQVSDEILQLSSLVLDTVGFQPGGSQQLTHTLGVELLDEVKSLSVVVNAAVNNNITSSKGAALSLEEELNINKSKELMPPNSLPKSKPEKEKDNSGWRFLGTKKVFKADWTEFDKRKVRRMEQQKAADKAKHRKKKNIRSRVPPANVPSKNVNAAINKPTYDNNFNNNRCMHAPTMRKAAESHLPPHYSIYRNTELVCDRNYHRQNTCSAPNNFCYHQRACYCQRRAAAINWTKGAAAPHADQPNASQCRMTQPVDDRCGIAKNNSKRKNYFRN